MVERGAIALITATEGESVNEEKQFLKPPEISPLLGVSLSRVYQLIATGVVPSVRIGGSLRIPRCASPHRASAP